MATTKITTHILDAVNRLALQFSDKQTIIDILTGAVTPVQTLEDALWQLFTERTIDTAIGQQLDDIGSIVTQPRNGLADAVYRGRIRAKISVLRSDGVVENLIQVATLMLDDSAATYEIEFQPPAGLAFRVLGNVPTDETADALMEFLKDSVAAGVRLILETLTDVEADTFSFASAGFIQSGLVVASTHSAHSDATLQYAAITDASQVGLDIAGDITLMSWINPDAINTASNKWICAKWTLSGDERSYNLSISSDSKIHFAYSEDGTLGNSFIAESAAIPDYAIGKWYHVCAVFNSSDNEVQFYLNGEAFGDVVAIGGTGVIYSGTGEFQIASADGLTAINSWEGYIDFVKVYDDQRTAAEIAAEYLLIPAAGANLQAGYALNNDFTDLSGNANTLTNSGMTFSTVVLPSQLQLITAAPDDWADTGTIDIDIGLAEEETIAYTAISSDRTVITATPANAHTARAAVQLNGEPGKGFTSASSMAAAIAAGDSTHSAHSDATLQYASITDVSQTGLDLAGDMTLMCWIRPNTIGAAATQFVISKYLTSGNNRSYVLSISTTDNIRFLYSDNGTTNHAVNSASAITDYATGKWFHIAAVFDSSVPEVQFYLNGRPFGTAVALTGPGTVFNGTSEFQIAAYDGSAAANSFDGNVDFVKVYNDQRTAAEILAEHMLAPAATAGLQAGYALNNDFTDVSGNGNTLTNSSMTFPVGVIPDRIALATAAPADWGASGSVLVASGLAGEETVVYTELSTDRLSIFMDPVNAHAAATIVQLVDTGGALVDARSN